MNTKQETSGTKFQAPPFVSIRVHSWFFCPS